MRMPTSKGGGARFRGPTSSHEYNTNEDQKYLELIELYKQSNLTLKQLKEAHNVLLAENVALNNYVKMLEDKLELLEGQLESLGSSSWMNGKFFKTSFVQDMSLRFPREFQDNNVKTPRCQKDLQYRYVTIPSIHEIPKTHLIDDEGKHHVPNQLKINVSRTNTGGEIIENEIHNAFNGDNESYWRRMVVYDFNSMPESGEEDVIIEIELPVNMVNNLNINTIQIHPHPERGIKIQNVEMHHNNGWEQIKGFKQDDISTLSEDFSPRMKWYFPSVPVSKLRITMCQKNAIDIGGKKAFVLGAQEIGVYLTMFEPSGGIVLTPFEMDGSYNIESVEHVFLNRKAFSYPTNMDHMLESKIFNYDVLREELDGTLTPISNRDWNNQEARTLWVRTHMYPDPHNGVNPCLHAVRLNYTKN